MTDPNSQLDPIPDAKDHAVRDIGVPSSATARSALDRSFVRGMAWHGSVKWLVQGITWIATITVARLLTPADYGLLSMGAVLLAFITLFSESGIGMAVLTVRDISAQQVAQLNGLAILLSLGSFVIAAVVAVPIGWFYGESELPPVIIASATGLIIASFRIVPAARLQRDLRFARLSVIEGFQGLIQAAATVLLALAGFRYWSLVLGVLLGNAFAAIAIVLSLPTTVAWPRWASLRPFLPFTGRILVTRVNWYIYQNSDFVVAGKRLGSEALGAYSYAWTLASMPVDKITALVSNVAPSMFASVQTDLAALRRYFLMVTYGLAAVTFPVTIGMALVAPTLVPVVFGERWLAMILPLQLLAAYAVARSITPVAAQVLVASGDVRFLAWQSSAAAILLPLSFIVGSRWGTVGIAVAWMIGHPLSVAIPVYARTFRRLGVGVLDFVSAFRATVFCCGVMAAVVLLVQHFTRALPQVPSLAAQVIAGMVCYGGLFALLQKKQISAVLRLFRRAAQ